MDLKHLTAKFISLALIFLGIYQTLLSFNAIFFIYPTLNPHGGDALIIQEGLVEKALILYASMVANGIYGLVLLFKPAQKVKMIHILSGILIFIGSIIFVVQTPFTTDPVLSLLSRLLGG